MMAVVVCSIVLDLANDAWVEWRRFLWGELALATWEKRFVVLEKAAIVFKRRGRS